MVSFAVIALVVAILFFTVGNKTAPRAVAITILIGSFLLQATPPGRYLGNLVEAGDQMIGDLTSNVFGASVTGIVGIVSAVVFGLQLRQKDVSWVTLGLAAILPFAIQSVGGAAGDIIQSLLSSVSTGVGSAGDGVV